MTVYRSDLEAALARNQDLERRVHELETALAGPTPSTPAQVDDAHSNAIASLVALREREAKLALDEHVSAEERKRRAAIARLARRPTRIAVAHAPDLTRITIAAQSIGDGLRDQAMWGIFFAGINPGAFIMFGFGAFFFAVAGVPLQLAALFAFLTWAVILMAINVVYARVTNPAHYLDLTATDHFALHTGNPRKAKLLGRTPALDVDLDENPDPSYLHTAVFRNGERVSLGHLTDRDITALRTVLAPRVKIS